MPAFNMPNSQSAFEYISAFRLRKFGLEAASDVLVHENPLARDLQGAISALATDLYAKHTHFIFELIQNAEDNTYAPGVVPSLSFHLCHSDPTRTEGAQGALIVQNNEIGFSSEQVEAICSVGRSTKRKAQGFIGEKGIGFKSVFRITSNPHIISNGYAFRLPEQHSATGLGYIVPCWLDDLPRLTDLTCTTIILPLDKPDITFDRIATFLREIAPETILFLSKLCHLRVLLDGEYDAVISKDGSQAPLVKLAFTKTPHGTKDGTASQSRYWTLTRSFQRPPNVTGERRDEVLNSEVTVAFPLEGASHSTGRVFAYLPVYEDSGLPFLMNADFLLAASREAVKEDEPWNRWLRDCVTKLFVEAFARLVKHPEHRELAYSFVPLSSNQTFLQPIVDHAVAELSDLACVWCEGTEQYSRPSSALMCEQQFRALVRGGDPPSNLRTRPFVSEAIERWHPQLTHMGVARLQYEDVVECLSDVEWLSARPEAWFADLYDYLMQHRKNMSGLEACPIVRVDGNRLSCDAEQPIYFFCDAETRSLLDSLPSHTRVPLAFLSPNAYALVGRKAGLRGWMTEALRVYDFSRANYAIDLVSWLGKNSDSVSDSELVQATQFLATFATDPTKLDFLLVVLRDGSRAPLNWLKSIVQHVVTPESADPATGWQHMFPDTADRSHLAVLSDEYIHTADSPDIVAATLRFLGALGVTDAPMPKRQQKPCYVTQGYWAELNPDLTWYERVLHDQYVNQSANSRRAEMTVEDSLPPRWCSVSVAGHSISGEAVSTRSRSVCKLLEGYLKLASGGQAWQRERRLVECGCRAEVRYRNYGWFENRAHESQFIYCLRKAAWLETTKGPLPPSSAFMDTPDIRQILGDSVPYVSQAVSSDVAELLGIRRHITAEEVLSVLCQCSEEGTEKVVFARRAFQYLNSLEEIDSAVVGRMRTERIICVPTATGNWHSAKDVIWSDRTDVLGDAFAYLERHYPKLKEFFVSTLDVKEDVDPECYARQWLSLQSATQPDVERTEGMLGIIYRELLGVLRKSAPGSADKPNGSGGEVSWLDEFARKARIWCQHKEFCEPTECYVPDDWELRRLFQGAGIPFVWRGGDKASFSDFEPLYRLLRVNYLSECVWARLLDTAGSHALEEPVFLTHGAKGWILTCLKEKYPTEYDEFVKAGGHQALLATTEAESSELVLEFSLGTATREARYSAFWDGNRRCLFHLGGDTRRADVAERLAKEVLSDRRYKDFAEAIEVGLGESAEDGKRRIRKRNWRVPAEIRGILGDVDVPEDDLPRPPSSTLDSASTADGGDKELGEGVKADDIGEHPVHWPEQAGIKNRLGMASGEDRDEAGHTHSLGPGASRTGTTDVVPRVDYMEHFRKAFHRPSTESVIGLETVSPGEVRDPARRREATRRDILGGIGAEPRAEERFRFVSVRRWEPKNEATRVKLEEWYGGRCQICGVTFVKRDGTQYFEGLYIVSRTQADWIDRPGNVLCLCANCCAKFQHGSVESARDVAEQVRSLRTRAEGGSGECGIEVVLCGEAVQVRYQERHFIDLQELLKIVEGSDSADGEPSTAVHSVPCREAFEAAADVTGSGEGEDTEGQRSQSAVTPIPSTEDEMRETTSASATPMMKKTETARTVEVGNVIIPASMAGVVHGRKYRECDRWILASKGGVTIAVFATERDLDRWWRLFQKSQGRKPKSLAVGKKPQQSKV